MVWIQKKLYVLWWICVVVFTSGSNSVHKQDVNTITEGVTKVDLGAVSVTVVNDGQVSRTLDDQFVKNVPFSEVQAALSKAGLPTDHINVPYNPIIVDINKQRILFDAGNGEFGAKGTGKLLQNMKASGIAPESITAVVFSHFHRDHINGLRNKDGAIVFPNAKIYVPASEWDWWMDDKRLTSATDAQLAGFNAVRRVFSPVASEVIRFIPGTEILSGVHSIPANGHTPGHTVFIIEGGSRPVLYWADLTNVALFVNNPDWAVMFDMDAETAKITRHRILNLAIEANALVAGYHLPETAIGELSKQDTGYQFTPLKP